MATLTVLNLVPAAFTYEEGETVRHAIERHFDRQESVTLSFAGVLAVSSSFVNAAFVKLLDRWPFDFVRSRLIIAEASQTTNWMVQEGLRKGGRQRAAV
jgi:hypothetical protein